MAEISKIDKYVIEMIRQRRNSLGITQVDLSIRLGMSDKYISQFEGKEQKNAYNVQTINEIAKILKCSPKDFLPDDPL